MTRFNHFQFLQTLTFAAVFSILSSPVLAQQITTDGYTATKLNTVGNKTTITTSTVKGQTAFNSFKRFNVNKGNVVDLIVPNQASNLINIIKDEATFINGTLNAIKNSQVGGNVFLVNPYGIVVGESGSVNVGSLTNITPTKDFVDNFFDSPGNPNKDAVIAILEGKAPNNPDAEVIIKGVIHQAQDGILDEDLRPKADIKDIVNLEAVEEMKELIIANGDDPEPEPTPCREKLETVKIVTTSPVSKDGYDPGPGPILKAKPVGDIDPGPEGPIIKENPSNKLANGGIFPPVPTKVQELQENPNNKLSDGGVMPPIPFKELQENPNNKLASGMPIPPIPSKESVNEKLSSTAPIPPIPMKETKELQENPNNKLSDGMPLPPVPFNEMKEVANEKLASAAPIPPIPAKVQELQENPNNKLASGMPIPPITNKVKELVENPNSKLASSIPIPPIPMKEVKELQENSNNKLASGIPIPPIPSKESVNEKLSSTAPIPPIPNKASELQSDSATQPPVAPKYTKLMLSPAKVMITSGKFKASQVKNKVPATGFIPASKVKSLYQHKDNIQLKGNVKPMAKSKVSSIPKEQAARAVNTHLYSLNTVNRRVVKDKAAYAVKNLKNSMNLPSNGKVSNITNGQVSKAVYTHRNSLNTFNRKVMKDKAVYAVKTLKNSIDLPSSSNYALNQDAPAVKIATKVAKKVK